MMTDRTGKLRSIAGISKQTMEEEVDYWQLPPESIQDEDRLGNKYAQLAMDVLRSKAEPTLTKLRIHIEECMYNAAKVSYVTFCFLS